jgi:hypothetical protein
MVPYIFGVFFNFLNLPAAVFNTNQGGWQPNLLVINCSKQFVRDCEFVSSHGAFLELMVFLWVCSIIIPKFLQLYVYISI